MIEEITNVTPDRENLQTSESKTSEAPRKEKKGGASRAAAMGGAMLAAGMGGAAVAHALTSDDDAAEVLDEVVEVEPTHTDTAAAARFFGGEEIPEVTPDSETDTKPEESTEDHAAVTPEEKPQEVTPEVEAPADETAEAPVETPEAPTPDYIEQDDMAQIEVHIDESLDMDDPMA